MNNAAIIAGHSLFLPFASSSEALLARLRQGEEVATSGWFRSDAEAVRGGFQKNRRCARLPATRESLFGRLNRLIADALAQAGLDKSALAGENVRVYLSGLGPRVDVKAYKNFYDRNDIDDLKLTPSVTQLQAANMSQDRLAQQLAQEYSLRYLPPNFNCASNSALAAVHLGCQAIEKGGVDLIMVIGCAEITTQDLWFLESQSMLESEAVQPFGMQNHGVLFAEGAGVMLLESPRHRNARQLRGGIRLRSVFSQIGASRNHDATRLTASLLSLIKTALRQADVALSDLCAIMPHGNGAEASDKAEAQALALLLAQDPLPVLAYKGLMGYTATVSGIIDLTIACYALTRRELIPARAHGAIIKELASSLLTGGQAVKHHKRHLLKTGVSVDGSIIAQVLSDETPQESADE